MRSTRTPARHRFGNNGVQWLSFSDLMSALLLIFILIMFYIMYQYFDMYEINMAEIARQQYDLDQANADLNEKTEKLSEALSGLSDKEQQIITFYYYEEMTVTQIAEMLECPEGTVMSRLNYARKNLKKKVRNVQWNILRLSD